MMKATSGLVVLILLVCGCVANQGTNMTNGSNEPNTTSPLNITLPSVQAVNASVLIGLLPQAREGWTNTTEVHGNTVAYTNGSYSVATIIYTSPTNESVEIGIIDSAFSSSPFAAFKQLIEYNNSNGYARKYAISSFPAIETYNAATNSLVLRVNIGNRFLVTVIGFNATGEAVHEYANMLNYNSLYERTK
jgi:hypothetical protein